LILGWKLRPLHTILAFSREETRGNAKKNAKKKGQQQNGWR